jgi:hypothetical protein
LKEGKMENSIMQEWNTYKKELETSLQEVMNGEEEYTDKETVAIMLEMLKIAKLKERIQHDDDTNIL